MIKSREEGLMEGSRYTKFKLTKNMLKKNISIKDIMEITDLSEEEIKSIQ